jgi:hypothetical protein
LDRVYEILEAAKAPDRVMWNGESYEDGYKEGYADALSDILNEVEKIDVEISKEDIAPKVRNEA